MINLQNTYPGTPYARFAVVRVNGDSRDAHAARATTVNEDGTIYDLDEVEEHDAVIDAIDLAIPDPGDRIEYAYVWALDAGQARLLASAIPEWRAFAL